MFKKRMLNLIQPKCNEIYRIHNPIGLKLLTRLQLGLSHLNDHKFNHNFRDCINQWQNIMGILKSVFKISPLFLYNVAKP